MRVTFRVIGVPLWVTYAVGLFGIFSTTLGIMGLIDHTMVMGYFKGADSLASGWAGRNAGIGLAMVVAFYLRDSSAYAATFVAAIFREIGDSFNLFAGNITMAPLIGVSLFLLVDISCFALSLRAALRQRKALMLSKAKKHRDFVEHELRHHTSLGEATKGAWKPEPAIKVLDGFDWDYRRLSFFPKIDACRPLSMSTSMGKAHQLPERYPE